MSDDKKKIKFKHGDLKRISEAVGMSRQAVVQALKTTTSLEAANKIQEAAGELGYDMNVRVKRVIVEIEPV
jgi:DNA-binding LacI/PurR family transcriptional regulator